MIFHTGPGLLGIDRWARHARPRECYSDGEGDFEADRDQELILADSRRAKQLRPHHSKTNSKTQKVRVLTDHQADLPTLSNRDSDDLVINVALSLACQLLIFKSKQFTWMLGCARQ